MFKQENPTHLDPRQDNYDRLIGLVIDYGSARERHGYLMGAPAEPQVKRDDAGRHRDVCFERVMDELARVLGVGA